MRVRRIGQESIVFTFLSVIKNISLTTLTRRQALPPVVLCTGSAFRFLSPATNGNDPETNVLVICFEKNRSRITKYVCSSTTPNLLSVRHHGSLVFLPRKSRKHRSAFRFFTKVPQGTFFTPHSDNRKTISFETVFLLTVRAIQRYSNLFTDEID